MIWQQFNFLKFKNVVFFFIGAFAGLFILIFGLFSFLEWQSQERIYPGVKVADVSFGGKTPKQVEDYFETQNKQFAGLSFTFIFESSIATISGEKLKVGYNSKLLSEQSFLIGRSGNFFSALFQKLQAKQGKINLPPSFTYDQPELDKFLEELASQIDIPPQEALFRFENGRVISFRPSSSGRKLNMEQTIKDFSNFLSPPTSGTITLSAIMVDPKVKTEEANNLGIKELLGEGKSYFRGSIENRVHNISLATSRLNGLLIAPGEVFSFNKALGEVSAANGYKQAYIIKEKKTVLDDGGGVCQVSTTLFRAGLNAGLPIEERHAHAYRVSYYEQGPAPSDTGRGGYGPGFDATVFSPTVDLKIKNDTPAHILIQTKMDAENTQLSFELYGTSDGRKVSLSKPRLWDQVPPPEDLYQDDPSLPKGQVKQLDFAAWGAKTSFDYKVTRGDEVLQNRTFYSNFQPWQAVYLRGTKE